MPAESLTAGDVIARLRLAPHPEGGFYRETFRDVATVDDARAASTAIYYLLPAGAVSHWHRVDAVEIWHWYAGAPLALQIAPAGGEVTQHVLGNKLSKGQEPQITVPPHAWQTARSMGDWTLVGCTVAPGFEFSAFELAPPDWAPGS